MSRIMNQIIAADERRRAVDAVIRHGGQAIRRAASRFAVSPATISRWLRADPRVRALRNFQHDARRKKRVWNPAKRSLNPLYEGATPEMVGKALLRPVERESAEGDGDKPSSAIPQPEVQSSI